MTGITVSVVDRTKRSGLADAVARGLSERGMRASVRQDGDPQALQSMVVVLLGAPASLRVTIGQIERVGPARPRVVAWLFEPLPPPELTRRTVELAAGFSAIRTGRRWARPLMRLLSTPLDAWLARRAGRGLTASTIRFLVDTASFAFRGRRMGWLDAIFVSTEQKRVQLADWGIAAEFLPVGQQPGFGRDLHLPRDIDLLFIGSMKSARRRAALARLAAEIRGHGLTMHVPDGPIWGEERTRLVNRARHLLHLHQFDWDTPWMRWCLASANGAVVISEPLGLPAPLRPGTDYLEAPLDAIAARLADGSRDEHRRLAMLAACRARIEETMTQQVALDRLADRLRGICAGGGSA